ncbi:MAG: AIPR family protein, partial [Clostridia bacterium]|nr:AIPR family protein [Clostridia bacterium]
ITTRDMVANRPEQRRLNEWLLDENYAQIYCEIRRGAQVPSGFNKGFVHRRTTNEELAQLAYAAFLQRPFTAKDKKSALFNVDYNQTEYTINKIYHDVFNLDENNPLNNGLIFTKRKQDIDEVLFVRQLYKECKKWMKAVYIERNASLIERRNTENDPTIIHGYDNRIATNALYLDTIGICMFYFIALYYEFKIQFPEAENVIYRFDKYYSDKTFRTELVQSASNLFLALTAKILVNTATENGKAGNVNNWVRSAACESAFMKVLRDTFVSDCDLDTKYREFCEKFKA